jgi:hypothetical protein
MAKENKRVLSKFKINSFKELPPPKSLKNVNNFLKDIDQTEGYKATKFGESKGVSYQIDGLIKSFCQVTEWPNGEGYDFSFETKLGEGLGYQNKSISLHLDEMECMFRGLIDLNYIK